MTDNGFDRESAGSDSRGGSGGWGDEEFSRRAEEFRKTAADLSHELRRLAGDFQSQFQVFAEDLRRRARSDARFTESPIERIRALAQLRDDGIITEAEFQEQKRRLLDQV